MAIVGPGRLGLALASALKRAHFSVIAATRNAATLLDKLESPSLVLLAVPDRALADVAAELARDARSADHWFAHTSGVQGADALAALKVRGAAVGAFHPLQSFGVGATAARRFKGAFCALEARGALEAALSQIARKLGMHPFRLAAKARPLYHLAAVLASNALVALIDKGEELLVRAGLPRGVASKILLPLVQGTLDNVKALGPALALTGPVVRGDAPTLKRHLALLNAGERGLYAVLMRQVLELAVKSGRLKPADARLIRKTLT
ncbi:MAG: DUF2520 domain-containing protein [Planctomycetes bacterium]|nr:DUF2520 domain-containing protein [Planctomycetota bacterium]